MLSNIKSNDMRKTFHFKDKPFFVGCRTKEEEAKTKNENAMKTYEIKSSVDEFLSLMGFSPTTVSEILVAGKDGKIKLCVTSNGSNVIIDTPTKDFTVLKDSKDRFKIESILSDIQDLIISGDLILIE